MVIQHSRIFRCLCALFFTAAVCVLLSWHKPAPDPLPLVLKDYRTQVLALAESVAALERGISDADAQELKLLFAGCRNKYKSIEWLVEYYYPSTALKLNGPALPEAEPSEPEEVMEPTGFQVLEEKIYAAEINQLLRREMAFDLSTIANRVQYLQAQLDGVSLSQSAVLDALKLNLYRLIAKGLAGFDTPVSLMAIDEIAPTLRSIEAVLAHFPKSAPVRQAIQRTISFVHQSGNDFNSFNRAVFISDYLNPLCRQLTAYQVAQKIPFVDEGRAVRPSSSTLFDKTTFDPLFYAPSGTQKATPQQVALGKALFAESLLSATGNRSCQSCHQPALAFSDGLRVNTVLDNEAGLLRNTPGLWNAGLQPVQFWDSRIAFLEDQVHAVVSSRQEMGGLFDHIVKTLSEQPLYRQKFAAAFGKGLITADRVRVALAAYVRSLVAVNSPFDQYMQGRGNALTKEQVVGFNLFMGKAKCGSCHFLPTFSGAVPPLYDKMETEVLGVPLTADTLQPVLDNDSGRYAVYRIPYHLRSFKTPSLRNVALTAPYMHNGVFTTLEEVIDFYDRGGGAGLRFDLPNQTLPPDRLNLTSTEKQQLISFLQTLTDTTVKKLR